MKGDADVSLRKKGTAVSTRESNKVKNLSQIDTMNCLKKDTTRKILAKVIENRLKVTSAHELGGHLIG